jgi:hypothetical protein
VVGCDVADEAEEVDGESAFSVASVFDVGEREQVAEFRGKLDCIDFGDEIAKIGYKYNTAMLNVEFNNMGIATCNRLRRDLAYPNAFRWPKFDEWGKYSKKEFWYTNPETKRLLIIGLRHAIRERLFIIRSPALRDEMITYRIKDGGFESGPGDTSDRIIAAALAYQCVAQVSGLLSLALGSLGDETNRHSAPHEHSRHALTTKTPFIIPRGLPDDMDETGSVKDIFALAGFEEQEVPF